MSLRESEMIKIEQKSLLNPRFFLISIVQNEVCRAENMKMTLFTKMLILEQNQFQNRFLRKNTKFPEYPNHFSERILFYWHSPNVRLEFCMNEPIKY